MCLQTTRLHSFSFPGLETRKNSLVHCLTILDTPSSRFCIQNGNTVKHINKSAWSACAPYLYSWCQNWCLRPLDRSNPFLNIQNKRAFLDWWTETSTFQKLCRLHSKVYAHAHVQQGSEVENLSDHQTWFSKHLGRNLYLILLHRASKPYIKLVQCLISSGPKNAP